jgi:hypothetical protein
MNSDSSCAETSGLALKTAAEDGSLVWSMPDGRTPDAIPVTITMSAKGGFLTAYYTRHLVFSSDRADYLSDEVYANFREVRGGAFPDGMLYRGCTPIEEYYGRTQTADELLAKYGIRTVINLANTNEAIEARIAAPDFVSRIMLPCTPRVLSAPMNSELFIRRKKSGHRLQLRSGS